MTLLVGRDGKEVLRLGCHGTGGEAREDLPVDRGGAGFVMQPQQGMRLSDEQLPAEYACADVLCVPSRYDGWGLVVPEGLAAGLPVIASDRMGAALEFVESGRNGRLVRAGDQEALLQAMREAATMTRSELLALGRRARESVSTHTLRNGAGRFFEYAQRVVT